MRTLLNRWTRSTSVAIPDPLWKLTCATLPFVQRLTNDERDRLRILAAQLLADKQMSAAAGLALTAAMQVSIARCERACRCSTLASTGIAAGKVSSSIQASSWSRGRSPTITASCMSSSSRLLVKRGTAGRWCCRGRTRSKAATIFRLYLPVVIRGSCTKSICSMATPMVYLPSSQCTDRCHPIGGATFLDQSFNRFVAELDLIDAELPDDLDPESDEVDHYYTRTCPSIRTPRRMRLSSLRSRARHSLWIQAVCTTLSRLVRVAVLIFLQDRWQAQSDKAIDHRLSHDDRRIPTVSERSVFSNARRCRFAQPS